MRSQAREPAAASNTSGMQRVGPISAQERAKAALRGHQGAAPRTVKQTIYIERENSLNFKRFLAIFAHMISIFLVAFYAIFATNLTQDYRDLQAGTSQVVAWTVACAIFGITAAVMHGRAKLLAISALIDTVLFNAILVVTLNCYFVPVAQSAHAGGLNQTSGDGQEQKQQQEQGESVLGYVLRCIAELLVLHDESWQITTFALLGFILAGSIFMALAAKFSDAGAQNIASFVIVPVSVLFGACAWWLGVQTEMYGAEGAQSSTTSMAASALQIESPLVVSYWPAISGGIVLTGAFLAYNHLLADNKYEIGAKVCSVLSTLGALVILIQATINYSLASQQKEHVLAKATGASSLLNYAQKIQDIEIITFAAVAQFLQGVNVIVFTFMALGDDWCTN